VARALTRACRGGRPRLPDNPGRALDRLLPHGVPDARPARQGMHPPVLPQPLARRRPSSPWPFYAARAIIWPNAGGALGHHLSEDAIFNGLLVTAGPGGVGRAAPWACPCTVIGPEVASVQGTRADVRSGTRSGARADGSRPAAGQGLSTLRMSTTSGAAGAQTTNQPNYMSTSNVPARSRKVPVISTCCDPPPLLG
jgi:hypothetical protein